MAVITRIKDKNQYMNQQYKVLVWQDDDGFWNAEIPALPGCRSDGETPEEALEMVQDAKHAWIEMVYDDGGVIPESDIN